MAKDIVKKRRTANATLAALIREIGENPMRDDLKAVELVGKSELDDDLELCDAIVNAMSEQAIDEVQDASQSGVGLFWQLMQEAIGRPFEHVAEAIKSVCEDTEACKGEEYLEADFKWWEAAVQEIRYTQFVSYQIIVESLGKLLHKQGALMQRCYIQWQLGTTDKEHEHETFNKVLEVVREKIDIVRGKTKQPGRKEDAWKKAAERAKGGRGREARAARGSPKGAFAGKGEGKGEGKGRDRICNFWRDGEDCPFGDRCRFEHSSSKSTAAVRFTIAEGATKEQLEATIRVARKKLKEQKNGAGNGGKAQGEQTWTGGNMYEILENRDSSKSLTCAKVVSSQKVGRQKTKTRVCMSVVKGQGGKEGKTGKVFPKISPR